MHSLASLDFIFSLTLGSSYRPAVPASFLGRMDRGGHKADKAVRLNRIRSRGWQRGLKYSSQSLLQLIFTRCWSRVRIFYITVRSAADVPSATWINIWNDPAPRLEVFKVITEGLIEVPQPLSALSHPNQLFSNQAPSLRRLHAHQFLTDFDDARHLSWLKGLVEVHLFLDVGPGVSYSELISEPRILSLFGFLRHLPCLEELEIQTSTYGLFEQELGLRSKFDCPRLKRITIDGTIRACLYILFHIRPGDGCSLHLETITNYGLQLTDEDVIFTLYSVRPVLGRRYQDFAPPKWDQKSTLQDNLSGRGF
ncbi:hypothetical protein D9613_003581 [Agrocybe pediades]|uniref:Uncharacterized protein n=1 Tax=Agrocybe pediades TaxID=84607 RepID=A0A8H4QJJ1_9AGAR|nr:hypothetical protein D9613_003581 [Agrocybe pediades]